jgi:hypothetical protein
MTTLPTPAELRDLADKLTMFTNRPWVRDSSNALRQFATLIEQDRVQPLLPTCTRCGEVHHNQGAIIRCQQKHGERT